MVTSNRDGKPSEPLWDNLWATARQIINDPTTWEQEHWACGTGACLAGWAVLLKGIQLDREDGSTTLDLTDEQVKLVADHGAYVHHEVVDVEDPQSEDGTKSRWAYIESVADGILGLRDYNHSLFFGQNKLVNILSTMDDLAKAWNKHLPEDLANALEAELDAQDISEEERDTAARKDGFLPATNETLTEEELARAAELDGF